MLDVSEIRSDMYMITVTVCNRDHSRKQFSSNNAPSLCVFRPKLRRTPKRLKAETFDTFYHFMGIPVIFACFFSCDLFWKVHDLFTDRNYLFWDEKYHNMERNYQKAIGNRKIVFK